MEANPKPPADHLPATPPTGRMYRTSLSLPAELAVQLNRIAKRLAVSQSALAQLVMEEPLRVLEGYPIPRWLAIVLSVSTACGLATAPILWLQFEAEASERLERAQPKP